MARLQSPIQTGRTGSVTAFTQLQYHRGFSFFKAVDTSTQYVFDSLTQTLYDGGAVGALVKEMQP